MKKIHSVLLTTLLLFGVLAGCHRTNLTAPAANPYSSDSAAINVMGSLYSEMAQAGLSANLSVLAGLSADELSPYPDNTTSSQFLDYYRDNLGSTTAGFEFWNIFYGYIRIADSVITGASASTGLSSSVKTQLIAQAQFIRAFSYFYLVNLYGDCPLILTTDSKAFQTMPRTPAAQVWAQIDADANAAAAALPTSFTDAVLPYPWTVRSAPTRWAATALLSRIYLYMANYSNALAAASQVINDGNDFVLMSNLDSSFLLNSAEAIWQLPPPNQYPYSSALEASNFIPPNSTEIVSNDVHCDSTLINAFEPGDLRRTHWVDSITLGGVIYYWPYKYKVPVGIAGNPTEAETVLRLSEQYLIRAEAEAQLLNLAEAINDLNVVRARAGLPNLTSSLTQQAVLTAVAHERQVELFTEWGQRWLDLKRTGAINTVMSAVAPLKGATWNANWVLWPVPEAAIAADAALLQNAGY